MADKNDGLIAGIDIGSSKIVCTVAQPLSQRSFRIEGMAAVSSVGMRDGTVVEINPLVEAIRNAVEEAEKQAQTSISRVTTGISGTHIRTENVEMTVVTKREEVEESDVNELLGNVQSMSLQPSMRYLAVIPKEYAVDNTWGIHAPIGLEGSRLDAKLHVVTAQSGPCQNISKALRRCGLELIDNRLNFNPLSTASAVLTPDEKRLGVILLDMGASLTEVAVYFDDAIQFSEVFLGGGEAITNEISIKTQLSKLDAEKLKMKMGQACFDRNYDQNTQYELPSYTGLSHEKGRVITREALSAIIDTRLYEILDTIYYRIRENNLQRFAAHGVVITGGCASLPGIDRMVSEIFSKGMAGRNISVRIGRPLVDYEGNLFISPDMLSKQSWPQKVSGVSVPEYATVMGYLSDECYRQWLQGTSGRRKGLIKTFQEYVKSWFIGNF